MLSLAENFKINSAGDAEFKGSVKAASFEGDNTMSTSNGKIIIQDPNVNTSKIEIDATSQRINIIDAGNTRVILGKLS